MVSSSDTFTAGRSQRLDASNGFQLIVVFNVVRDGVSTFSRTRFKSFSIAPFVFSVEPI